MTSLDTALRARPPHIMTLVIATATGALSMNVFLPSLPGMARFFSVEYATIQLTVTLYLAATAIFQLLIGPASDRFGRRPVLLTCLAVFCISTTAAMFATTIHALLLCRILQAFAVGGVVVGRAVVRDIVGTDDAASKIGYITMGMAFVPMIAPAIGGFLDELYGWQSTFLFTLSLGLIAFTIVYLDLRETNHARTGSLSAQIATYPELLGSRRFWGYSAVATFNGGAFFAFIGGAPFIASEIMHIGSTSYGLYFGIVTLGYILGNFLSGRFGKRIGINRMMILGCSIASFGIVLAIALFMVGFNHPFTLFVPVIFTGIGNGLTLPSANAGMVSVRPHLAGSASGLGGAIQLGVGAILTIISGKLLSVESGPYPLLYVMLVSSVLAVFAALFVVMVDRKSTNGSL